MTAADFAPRPEHQVLVTLAIDSWRPTVLAERLMPEEYGFCIHPDPWTLYWAPAGQPMLSSPRWCVSEVDTGRIVSFAKTRAAAVFEVFRELKRIQDREGLATIEQTIAYTRGHLIH